VTTYPVELPGGFSGLSAGQIQGIAKAPFTGHFNNAPMLGDRRPKTLIAATGAWYFDNAPHGDYSGTEQNNGTGGPAQMEFSPTGTEGVVTIGRVRQASGTRSTTTASTRDAESVVGGVGQGDDNTISSTVFSGCAIGDVVSITVDTSSPSGLTVPGTYYVVQKFSDTQVKVSSTLGGSVADITATSSGMSLSVASPTSFQGEQSITYNHATYGYKLRVINTHAAPITGTAADWHATNLTITKTSGGFSSYTYTGWDMVYITAGGLKGWYRIASKDSNDVITLTADSTILSSSNLTGTVSFEVYPCNFATYVAAATWNESAKTLTAASGTPFAGYTAGTDDVVLIKSGDGTALDYAGAESWCKVASESSSTVIVLSEGAIADNGATNVEFILFKRPTYTEYAVSTASVSGRTAICSATTLSPVVQVGDLYYMYVDMVDGEDAATGGPNSNNLPYTTPTNDPEGVPTATALTSTYCPWPANTFSSQVRMSVQGNQGLCTVPESRLNTEMNAAWWGLFTMPKETLVYGDKLCINFSGGYDYNGTPFIFEIAIIPNFDPEVDWEKLYEVESEVRLANKAVWFQTDPIYHSGTASRDIAFNIECQSGGYTEGAGSTRQYIHNWMMTLDIASGTAATNPYTAPTQQKRYFTKTFVSSDIDLHSEDTRWTILVKTEHPSMKGKPGYHGYYFGEPFSATTGNGGGVWLHHTGTVAAAAGGTTVKLPLAPRSRFTNFNVTYYPNGSY
jgi:hypothetical protein